MASDGGDAHRSALHEAIQREAPIGSQAILTGWVLVAEWIDHDGDRWISKAHSETTSQWAADGMMFQVLFKPWPGQEEDG